MIIRRDDRPRRFGMRCLPDHVLERATVPTEPSMRVPVFASDPPLLVRVVLEGVEAAALFALREIQEELDDRRTVRRERLLEPGDLPVRLLDFLVGDQVLDALDQHPAVPRAVEAGEGFATRRLQPEAPQPGA